MSSILGFAYGVRNGQAPLIPEARRDRNVRRLAMQILNSFPRLRADFEDPDVLDISFMNSIRTPFIRQNKFDASFACGFDKSHFLVFGCCGGHCDDESVLAAESLDEGFGVGVVDLGGEDSFWEDVFAVWAGQGRDGVFAGFQQGVYHVASAAAASLCPLVCKLFR